jgi:rubrerythrin
MEKEAEPVVMEEFKKRRTRQLIAVIPILLAAATIAMTDESTGLLGVPSNIIIPVAIVVLLAVVAFSMFNWRCPACQSYLGKGYNPQFCPKCGKKLRN